MSDPNQDFFSFDEALNQLRLKEEELKRLVSEGEIRAFREGDTMKLRRRDVEQLREELTGGEVVELGGGGDELVFEDDLEDPGMATEEIATADTIVDDDLELEEALGELDVDEDYEDDDDDESFVGGPAEEEVKDSPLILAASLGTLLLLIMAGPLMVSITSGNLSDFAKSIAGIFASVDEPTATE